MGCFFRVLALLFAILGGVVCELGNFIGISHGVFLPDLFKKGKVLRAEGRFEEAIGTFSEALAAAQNQGLASYEQDCLFELGILHWNIGKPDRADCYFRETAHDSKHAEDIRSGMSLFLEGVRFLENQDYDNAEGSFLRGLELSGKTPSPEIEVRLHRHLGEVYFQLGDLKQFFLCNEKALHLSRGLRHRAEEGKSLNNIGIFHLKTNRHEMALAFFEKALQVFIESEEHDEILGCLKNIGDLYAEWGDFDKSFSYLYQAVAQGSGRLKTEVLADHLLNIGLTYRMKWIHYKNVHDLFQALSYSRRALEIEGLQKHQKILRSILKTIGVIFYDIGQYEDALDYFREVEEMISDRGFDEEFVGLINNKGRTLMAMDDGDEAVRYFEQALELAEACGCENLIWESHTGLGEYYKKKKLTEKSLEHFTRAIETIEKIRGGISTDIYKTGFSRNKMQAYHGVIDLLFEKFESDPSSDSLSELFSSVEKAKAHVFLESLVDDRWDLGDGMRRIEKELTRKISGIIHSLNSTCPSSSEQIILKDQLLRTEGEYMRWVSKIKNLSRSDNSSQYPNLVSLHRIQSELLDERTALVEYFLGDKRSLVFLVTQEACRVFPLPPRRIIENQMKGYLKLISQPPEEEYSNHQPSERIAEDLLLSVFSEEDLENLDALIIVPDGLLHFLPFESLRITTSSQTRFLVERLRISYAASASALFVLNRKENLAKPKKMLLAFGNPKYRGGEFQALPYSRKEIAAISKVFPKRQIDVFERKKANKDLLKSLDLSDYQILHFACHGYVDEKFPLRSSLVLSPISKEDNGILQVREIYGMRMNAELVVLSACQSGGGRIEYSEGIVGLPRVFLSAGSRSVIASLWAIRDDSAAKMMQFFYEGLSEGKSKSQALRSAKLKMLTTRYSHPHYWAAFVLHGEHSSSMLNPTY